MLLLHDQRPNYVTILSVIRAVGALNREEMTGVVHAFAFKLGVGSEVSIVTALLGLYSLHNDMIMVWQSFYGAEVKDLVLWSALVNACMKNGKFADALNVFRDMQVSGFEPNYVSILSILPACADLGVLPLGKQIHGFCIVRGLYTVTNIQNSLMDMYAKCGVFECSIKFFDRLRNMDLISWNTMICGSMENGYPKEALSFFHKMLKSGFQPDKTTIRSAITACSQAEEVKFGYGLHCYSIKSRLEGSVSVGTALCKMYADFGDIVSSRIVFDCLPRKDMIAWSAMISVYAQTGHSFLAFELFSQMQSANEEPNEVTLVSLLQACSSMKSQEFGKVIHGNVTRNGYSSNVFITSALIDLYCKFGQLAQGEVLFNSLPYKDIISWSSMINGYGINGFGDKALETFSKMLDTGLKPNGVVFTSVLSACSHCGLEDEGWKWFNHMKEHFGIIPALSHYSCMVDLLSRAGKIEEAFRFINEMPLQPDATIWGALLAGCKTVKGYVGIAEFAAERLLTLDPDNTSYYVILSNIYADHIAGLSLEMNKEGILEILLVSAQDIRNPNFIGKPCYYVIAHCGKQEVRSKTVSGEHKKAVWNEKLVLRFPFSDLENMAHLKLRIMDTSTFSKDGNFIGETRIHLGGVITEGTDKGFIELKPARYKVVLEDDRYKGEIKIGLKFKKLGDVQPTMRECVNLVHEKKSLRSMVKTIASLWLCQRWKFFFLRKKPNPVDVKKQS
ncbi:hypothetical protein MKW98_008071 [Papaver atlanticum]|uniref:C2 domain-containing protein n=1 Tax=Papaver atlanticum TaxID=357466 RepID=A0AAD4S7P8_9MAGN|nr:hypothetical protein MKW98_008071 [Papaver atlanticum]